MIASLQCRNLRSLSDTAWELESGSHLLLGGTGEGKTSLLEAIYLATTTRSFRTSRLSDCLRHDAEQHGGGPPGFYTSVEVSSEARSKLEVSWDTDTGVQRRLNGDRSSLEDHLSQQPILSFSVADIEVLVGAPELRRRLVDRISVALHPSSLSMLSRYRKALDHKRALLAQRGGLDRDALRGFNAVLAESAASLIARRRASIQALRTALASVNAEFPRDHFEIDVTYRSSPSAGGAEIGASAIFDAMEETLQNEVKSHRPLIGPHRDRIDIHFRSRPVAETASAGERKAVALLLLAAQERLLAGAQRPCVLLVDDVDTEMDQHTLEAIWPLLVRGPQTLFSSNREAVFERLSVSTRWDVERGSLKRR